MLDKWRDRVNPEQFQALQGLYETYQEIAAEENGLDFESYLAQQGWIFPKEEQPALDTLLGTLTAELKFESEAHLVLNTLGQNEVYTHLETLGQGDLGQIELVKETTLQRKIAMKRLKEGGNLKQLQRFLIEAQITAQLDHPNILPIYTLENTQVGLAYTMKRLQGHTFEAFSQKGSALFSTPQAERLDYFLAVCDALEYAHSQGVIHRELEPGNLMVGYFNEVYVMNWGSARLRSEKATLELVLPQELEPLGAQVAEPLAKRAAYYSPEQAAGEWTNLEISSDIYALGLILYELISSRPAVQGQTPLEILEKASRAEMGMMIDVQGRPLPLDLRAIIQRACAKTPSQRYTQVTELSTDLKAFLRGDPVSARRDNLWQSASRWLVRHQVLALNGLMAVVFVSAGIGIWSLWSQERLLRQARLREQAIHQFQAAVYTQSRKMNRQFLRAEKQLEALTAVAISHFSQRQPAEEKYYLHGKFQPPDLVDSGQYHSRISVNWPLSVKTYSLPESLLATKLAQLATLRHLKQRILVESNTYEHLNPAQIQDLIAHQGTQVTYATMILKEGGGAWLPGGDFEAEKYDPIQRPFYQFGAYQHQRRWGNPYIDVSGAGLLLTAATGLFDHQQTYLGTASLDMKFDTIIQTMLDLPADLRQVQGGYILDDQGRIAIRSSQKGKTFSATIHPNLQLPLYPHPEVVKAVKAKRSGSLLIGAEDPLLVVYYRLPDLGWYYLVEAKLKHILANS